MEHLGGGASPESFGENTTLPISDGSRRQPASGSIDNSQSRTRLAGGPTLDKLSRVSRRRSHRLRRPVADSRVTRIGPSPRPLPSRYRR